MLYVCICSGAGGRQSELIDALKLILDRLNSGNIPITEEMVRRAEASGIISSKTGGTSLYTVHGGTIVICSPYPYSMQSILLRTVVRYHIL